MVDYLDRFDLQAQSFNIKDIYQHYYSNVSNPITDELQTKRYPIQAFLDIYFFDTLQEHARCYDEKQRLLAKTRRFSQLAQRLFYLRRIEEAFVIRLKAL